MKARRMTAPREVSRRTSRRIYRPRAREKSGVDRNSENLLSHHRSGLRYLLAIFSEQQKWHHAAGVVSVLIGIPFEYLKSTALAGRRSDVSAAMDVMKRVDCVDSNDLRVRRMFRILSLQQPDAKLRLRVQLELALYFIRAGDREAAYDELRPIVDGKSHREDPVANFCHGLNSYYLWYEKSVEDVSRELTADIGRRLENEGFLAKQRTGENNAREGDDQSTYLEWTRTPLRGLGERFRLRDSRGSRAAIQIDWELTQFEESSATGVDVEVNIWEVSQRFIYEETDEQGFVQTGEQFWRTLTVPLSSGSDRHLFPIQIQQDLDQKHYEVPMSDGRTRDLHAAAVKHLKQALSSAPDMLPALLPLVQLLLGVHDIKGAVDEIHNFSTVLRKHFVPPSVPWKSGLLLSIKIALLDSLDKKNPVQLAAGHRDVLLRNPSSFSSLKGLFKLHASGKVETELLLQCICLHLDVCHGAADIWRKLASCLLEVEQRLQQLSSRGVDINLEDESSEEVGLRHSTSLSQDKFLEELWSSRYSWWLRKHFNPEVSGDEQYPGRDKGLLAYKAACSTQIYGTRVGFLEHVCKTLKK